MRAIAIVLAVALGGCATAAVPVTVEVPVVVYCAAPVVPAPALPIDSLVAGSDVFVSVRALWATVEVLEAYGARLQVALDACRPVSRDPRP